MCVPKNRSDSLWHWSDTSIKSTLKSIGYHWNDSIFMNACTTQTQTLDDLVVGGFSVQHWCAVTANLLVRWRISVLGLANAKHITQPVYRSKHWRCDVVWWVYKIFDTRQSIGNRLYYFAHTLYSAILVLMTAPSHFSTNRPPTHTFTLARWFYAKMEMLVSRWWTHITFRICFADVCCCVQKQHNLDNALSRAIEAMDGFDCGAA